METKHDSSGEFLLLPQIRCHGMDQGPGAGLILTSLFPKDVHMHG